MAALLILLSVVPLISASPVPAPNGRIPLYLMGEPTPERMELALMSGVVEAEDLSGDQLAALHRANVSLILYDWLFAKYEDEVRDSRDHYLVRFRGPYGPALAYDYGSPEVRSMRVRELLDGMGRDYVGVFFDWFPAACDPEIAESSAPGYVEEFRRRHPDQSLEGALLSFIRELRDEGARRGLRVIVVSNQAYRCGPSVMALVDWDISESYFSDVENGVTVLFPWQRGSWESPATYVPEVVGRVYEEARRANFRLGFTHVSYAMPGNVDAAFYDFAGARVFGHDGIALAPSEMEGEVVRDGIPNAYWLGCLVRRFEGDEWSVAVYDLGIVAAGQVPVTIPELRGARVYDLREGRLTRLGEMGRRGPWGSVYLRMDFREGVLSCLGGRGISIWSDLVEGALESLAIAGNCTLRVRSAPSGLWTWREASREVAIVANDIDWNLSGPILMERIRKEGIDAFRAPLTLKGLKTALLDSKVVLVLGGRESPVTGHLMEPLTSRMEGMEGRIGPGRLVVWLWGEDRYGTREEVASRLDEVLSGAREVLFPLPRCPGKRG